MEAPLAVIANRGPNDFVWDDGAWVARKSSGGLVSMLEPLAGRSSVTWFCCVSEPPDARSARRWLFTTAADQTDASLNVVPVPLPAPIYQAYYGQISNEVLWMLQHFLIGPRGFDHIDQRRHQAWSGGYLEANRRLADAVASASPPGQTYLIQDYHLYPLPALLRTRSPASSILHFTHIPFPEPSMLRMLPRSWREAILYGLLGSDVVGVQTRRDVHAFLACCAELPDAEVDLARSTVLAGDGRRVAVRAYPASVDPAELRQSMRSDAVQSARHRLAARLAPLNVIRVDRLDPSKNQLAGFLAFARLLQVRPELRSRVRFLAFLVPSRTDLSIYRTYRKNVLETIDKINQQFANDCDRPPIEVFYTNDREQALAAMETCDVLLVNSLKDGMNLVAKEWAVISRRPGVLIVSETAGVADDALDSALQVSPLDVEGTAQALGAALDMPPAEREARLDRLRDRVCRWTAANWLSAQLGDLGVSSDRPGTRPGAPVSPAAR